ncbi:Co2+/Mg2+ efflux protein ApaG [Aestuariivirga sp.]|uniref:Co2+/Mg2+ efflux protein ApaG n=1 Tax=Aestuariivirga sp. TaxID=2650926 RepID=UPI0039E4B116
MYQAISNRFRVTVRPQFLEGQSKPDEDRYVWAYTITIENLGSKPAKLISRHWIITDARGHKQEVIGEGVVGEQPTVAPGDSFQYTSGCPLTTPSGMMVGSYHMLGSDGHAFAIDIPAFSLDSPHERPTFN